MGKRKKLFINAEPEFYFRVIDGSEIKSLPGLAEALGSMSDDSFYYHVSEHKNDFSSWIRDVFNENELAENVGKAKDKPETELHVLRFMMNRLK